MFDSSLNGLTDFWAITTYFNPCGYRSRYQNYLYFRQSLQVPLLTVELAYGEHFKLTPADATQLVQLRSDQVMWQKERLLNLVLAQLPPECRKVAWVDCDLIFERDDWAARASQALENFAMVQPFDWVYDLGPRLDFRQPWTDQIILGRDSLAARYRTGKLDLTDHPFNPLLRQEHNMTRTYSAGHAWAMRRETLEDVGLYDAMIIGGGDLAIVKAAVGQPEDLARHYLNWSQKFHRAVEGRIGVVPGALHHLWHGDLKNRQYRPRRSLLARAEFDPYLDLALDANGSWRWNSDKPALHQPVQEYFENRREDNSWQMPRAS